MIENEYIFTRIITTKYYHYALITQILLTFVLAYMVFKQIERAYILQALLAIFMTLDILLRYLGDNTGTYWHSKWNKADIVILVVLAVLFLFQTVVKSFIQIQEFQVFIIVLRTASQLYRMGRLIKQQKDARQVQNLEPVDLSFDNQNFLDKFH